jgi:hypothetical protein
MEAPKLSKYEYAIPKLFLERFKGEPRVVFGDNPRGVWVFPPDWINRVDAELAKSLEGYTLVAVPTEMLRG